MNNPTPISYSISPTMITRTSRDIYLIDRITPESCGKVLTRLRELQLEDERIASLFISMNMVPPKNMEINIFIDSVGGSAYACLTLFEEILKYKTQINTHALGFVASAGTIIYLAGHKRYAYENSTFLFHEGATMVFGDLHTIANETRELYRLQDIVNSIYLKRTLLTNDMINKINSNKGDTYYSAFDAKQLGIVTNFY